MTRRRVCIVTPVFNDWESFSILAQRLSEQLGSASGWAATLVAVDDGSTESDPLASLPRDLSCRVVRLVRNVGHTRAIAVGLCHAVEHESFDALIVMDADGEDRPEDVPALLSELIASPGAIVVADRRKRSEGLRFRLFYWVYRFVFHLLTGLKMTFGNFSAMTRPSAERLVRMNEALLHFPAALLSTRLPLIRHPTDRGTRYRGSSKLGLTSLCLHGFSSVAVFSERCLTRLLLTSAAVFAVFLGLVVTAVVLKIVGAASPGWVTSIIGSTVILLVQTATLALGGLFVVLNSRSQALSGPTDIAARLIRSVETVSSDATTDRPARNSTVDARAT